MEDPNFEDFILEGGWDLLLFPGDENKSLECSFCGRRVQSGEQVEWPDKKEGKFKCPDCGEELEIEQLK